MQIFQVDAFASEAFRGNPAAVCLLDDRPGRSHQWMQSVAAEMNLAETAFVAPATPLQGAGAWDLRWFTPEVEVDLCGHATLATAHVLWEQGVGPARLEFRTRSGRLTAERDGADGAITLDFPADPVTPLDPPEALAGALGVVPTQVGRGRSFLLAELVDAGAVRTLRPDLVAVRALDAIGVIVTATGDGDADFVSRVFAPAVGIPEDPVTGSAHCCLAPYWASRLGRDRLVGYQASPRGGYVGVGLDGDRVALSGRAVTVLRGELLA